GSSRRRFSQMPTGKRASMREGPLAALFRKTAEDTGASPREADDAASARPTPSHASDPSEPERRAHPSLQAPAPASAPAEAPETEEPRIPSPQERLRHAFSADIPENLTDRPAKQPVQPPAPEPDVYARSDRAADAYGAPKPVGTPVLRVVGVGGAGV